MARPPASLRQDFWRDLRAYWPLWLIVAAGIFLRFYEVHRLPGMQGDEAWYGIQSRRLLAGEAVAWRTPTGNIPGQLHLGSLTLLHAIFPPSLLLLRIPALLSSLGGMAMAYVVGRRFFGPAAGMAAIVLMACLPINIAYARLGWDPSHSPLLILACAYAAFSGRKLLCALLFALALTNHPAAVFVAPFITLGFLGFLPPGQPWLRTLLDTLALVGLLLAVIVLVILMSPSTTHYVLAGAPSRLADPDGWTRFGLMFCRLLSGDTIYTYVTGVGLTSLRPWADWIIGIGLVAAIVAGIAQVWRRADLPMAGLLAGMIVSLALMYLVSGNWVLSPKFERFGYPMVSIFALTFATILNGSIQKERWFQPLIALISVPMLAGFWLHYIAPLNDGKYRQVEGFWTADEDPAWKVFQRVSAELGRSGGGRIIAEDWWLQGPISYYAIGEPYEVLNANKMSQAEFRAKARDAYWVTFGGSPFDRALARRSEVELRWIVPTANRDSNIRIWK